MAEIPDARRTAAFRCHLALADPTGAIRAEAKGMCRGWITREHRGDNGFGYDSLFLILEYHKTFGELGPIVKRHLSHRARAFEQTPPAADPAHRRGRDAGRAAPARRRGRRSADRSLNEEMRPPPVPGKRPHLTFGGA